MTSDKFIGILGPTSFSLKPRILKPEQFLASSTTALDQAFINCKERYHQVSQQSLCSSVMLNRTQILLSAVTRTQNLRSQCTIFLSISIAISTPFRFNRFIIKYLSPAWTKHDYPCQETKQAILTRLKNEQGLLVNSCQCYHSHDGICTIKICGTIQASRSEPNSSGPGRTRACKGLGGEKWNAASRTKADSQKNQ